MAIYKWRGEEYLVMNDQLAGDLHIPMDIVTEAITRTADDGFDADQIEAYIRDSMAVLVSANVEAAVVPSSEEISLEDAEVDRSLALLIDGETYRVDTDRFGTLKDLAVWISETLNQAMERAVAPYIAQQAADLENLGYNITLKIKM